MHLYMRTTTLVGGRDALAAAQEMRAFVDDRLDTGVALWAVNFGGPVGTVSFTTLVDGLAGAAAMAARFQDDDEYWQRADGFRHHLAGPPDDHLLEPIHGEFGGEAPVGAVATATMAVGDAPYANVVGWGVEAAQLVEEITGQRVIFGTDVGGTFGAFGWITVSADAAAADAANTALRNSEEYVAKLSSGTDLFVSGASTRTVSTRVG